MTEPTTQRPSDRPWSGPLGSPYLTAQQRQRLSEDLVLVAEAGLDPDDRSPYARQIRAAAESVRDHRDAAAHRHPLPEHTTAVPVWAAAPPRGVIEVAEEEWPRWTRLDAQVVEVTDVAWQPGYAEGFAIAYTNAAARIIAAATDAAAAEPLNWLTLHPLAVAASEAIMDFDDSRPAPPADRSTLDKAQATASGASRSSRRHPAHRVAEIAWHGGHTAGTLAGTLTATTDIRIRWIARGGQKRAAGLRISDMFGGVWVADLLATVNRDTAASLAARRATPTAAQLARQDQSPTAAAPTSTGSSRARPSPASALRTPRPRR